MRKALGEAHKFGDVAPFAVRRDDGSSRRWRRSCLSYSGGIIRISIAVILVFLILAALVVVDLILMIRRDLGFAVGLVGLVHTVVHCYSRSGPIGVQGNVVGDLVFDVLVLEPVLEGPLGLGVAGGGMLEDHVTGAVSTSVA
jgi:hypothetical protein